MKYLLTSMAFCAVLSGCSTATTTPGGQTTPAGSNSPTQATTVSIKNFNFSPATLNVKSGTQVVFKNEDSSPHTATAEDGSFNTGTIDPGKSATITVTKSASYKCNFHATMKGSLNLN